LQGKLSGRTIAVWIAVLLPLGGAAVDLHAQDPVVADTLPAPAVEAVDEDVVAEISPAGAFLRSLVLPGWGQAAVGAPVRGTVYFSIGAGSFWMLGKSRVRLADVRASERFIREDERLESIERDALLEGLAPLRRSRQDQVEDWATFAVFTVLLSAADALVSAYLADFDAHIGVGPGGEAALRLELTVPVGR